MLADITKASSAQNGIGDVLITWENEAFLAKKEFGADKFDIVLPSLSILAEPPVAVVSANCEKHNTCKVADEYLQFLYSETGQELAAKHFFRPRDSKVMQKYSGTFPTLQLVSIGQDFGGWDKAHAKHFADGGSFDEIYATKK